jgi:hypothetical protein
MKKKPWWAQNLSDPFVEGHRDSTRRKFLFLRMCPYSSEIRGYYMVTVAVVPRTVCEFSATDRYAPWPSSSLWRLQDVKWSTEQRRTRGRGIKSDWILIFFFLESSSRFVYNRLFEFSVGVNTTLFTCIVHFLYNMFRPLTVAMIR